MPSIFLRIGEFSFSIDINHFFFKEEKKKIVIHLLKFSFLALFLFLVVSCENVYKDENLDQLLLC